MSWVLPGYIIFSVGLKRLHSLVVSSERCLLNFPGGQSIVVINIIYAQTVYQILHRDMILVVLDQ